MNPKLLSLCVFSFISSSLVSSQGPTSLIELRKTGHIIPWTETAVYLQKHSKSLHKNDMHMNDLYKNQMITKSDLHSNQDLCIISQSLLLKGGGIMGAKWGFWLGKSAVYTTHALLVGGIAFISNMIVPGSGPVTGKVLAVYTAPYVEAASNAIGIATGLALAVETGPV